MMEMIIILLIVGLVAWRIIPAKGVMTVSVNDLTGLLTDQTKQFIDVRTPNEYRINHIKEFQNIPLNELKSRLDSLDKSKETFVICQSGMRSGQAASTLKKAGFAHVINVKDGMCVWKG